ncbi:uncharacterized protein LOC143354093 [Halictus rubicundus]|uniref:uncharacterized protein LOC143354093 n=1 Tax=Halictus rubicundus TaxID=77578 RepID=UPI004036BFEE
MRQDRETADLYAFSSTMTAYSDCRAFLSRCVLLALLVACCAAREICDKSKCPGPLRYYTELECKPIYKNPEDCCAEAFDCSHLEKLSKNKCYINGREYSIGEKLKDEDANPCDIGCTCREGYEGRAATFVCAQIDCPFFPPQENCHIRQSFDKCCPSTPVCLKEGEKRATCEVDGIVYYDGESFTPKSDPDLNCHCLPEYKGENVEPFCKKPNHGYCSPLFRNADEIHEKCAPVFYAGQNVQKDCSYASRCADNNDSVVHNHDGKSVTEIDESKVCQFGNLTMHIGDTLNEGNTFESVCTKCKCEVPPIPTCMRMDVCDTTKIVTTPFTGVIL